jgi:hypothetical protein
MSSLDHLKALVKFAKQSKDPDLLEHVITLQTHVLELQDRLRNLESDNRELRGQLEQKSKMIFRKPFYYVEGDEVPFCPRCYEENGISVHLIGPTKVMAGIRYGCPSCNFVLLPEKFRE